MKVKIITSIHGLLIDNPQPLTIQGIAFVNYHQQSVYYFLGEEFLTLLGEYGRGKIYKDCALACTENIDPYQVYISDNREAVNDAVNVASAIAKNYIDELD